MRVRSRGLQRHQARAARRVRAARSEDRGVHVPRIEALLGHPCRSADGCGAPPGLCGPSSGTSKGHAHPDEGGLVSKNRARRRAAERGAPHA